MVVYEPFGRHRSWSRRPPGAPLYGMLTDRFGVTWVLDGAAPYNG